MRFFFLIILLIIACSSSSDSSPTQPEIQITTSEHYIEVYQEKTFDLVAGISEGSLNFSLLTQPSYGNVTLSGSKLTYRPNNGFVGNDSFIVKATVGSSSKDIPIFLSVFDNPYKSQFLTVKDSLEIGLYGDKKNEIKFTVDYEGIQREFILIIPKNLSSYNKNNLPVVIHLHGNTQTGNSVYSNHGSFIRNAKELKFYYVIPSGLKSIVNGGTDDEGTMTGWNAHFPGFNTEYDDSGFLKALINYLHDNHSISHEKIYLTGFSSGAHFAYTAANENILIDGIQVFGGWMNKYNNWVFNQPLRAQHYHGTNDHVYYYEYDDHYGGENSIKEIARLKNCQSSSQYPLDDVNNNGFNDTTFFSYGDCNDGSVLQHFRLENEVHVSSTSVTRNDISSLTEFFNFFGLGEPIY